MCALLSCIREDARARLYWREMPFREFFFGIIKRGGVGVVAKWFIRDKVNFGYCTVKINVW